MLILLSQFATGHLDLVNPAPHIWWEGGLLFCIFKDKSILIIPNAKNIKKSQKPHKTTTTKNQKPKQTKKTSKNKLTKSQVAQFWTTSPKDCVQGQVTNWVMTRSGGFPIKLLLLLQAKQTTCSSCSLLLFYGDWSQPLSSLPEEISGIITLAITNTQQPQTVPLPQKVLLAELEHRGCLGFAGSLQHYHKPCISLPGSGSGTTKILLVFQRKPMQKDESCQGIPVSFAQWRAAAKGDRQCGSSNTERNLDI